MPVIGHQTIGGDPKSSPLHGLRKDPLTGNVVRGFLKQWQSTDAPVEYVIGNISGSKAWTARHPKYVPAQAWPVKK